MLLKGFPPKIIWIRSGRSFDLEFGISNLEFIKISILVFITQIELLPRRYQHKLVQQPIQDKP